MRGCKLEVMRLRITLLLIALVTIGTVSGCHHSANNAPAEAANYKVYKLRGKVVSTNPATGEVTLDHEAIPGFMEAMTMPYKLKDPGILGDLHPGDKLTADVLVSQNADADVLLDHIVIITQGKPDYRPKTQYHVPAPGDAVPDFKLTDQDGRPIHLGQYKGKALLVTFIYTRCPLPNFCPRVTKNFALIEQKLAADQKLYARTHLLCISFDPGHDTPERLRAYAEGYAIGGKPNFKHWGFAALAKQNIDEVAQYFDVGLTEQPDSTITHTLSTTLIGPDGKVVKFYPGNEWTADELSADIAARLK